MIRLFVAALAVLLSFPAFSQSERVAGHYSMIDTDHRTLDLHPDNTFREELLPNPVFDLPIGGQLIAHDSLFTGKWERQGDTLILNYNDPASHFKIAQEKLVISRHRLGFHLGSQLYWYFFKQCELNDRGDTTWQIDPAALLTELDTLVTHPRKHETQITMRLEQMRYWGTLRDSYGSMTWRPGFSPGFNEDLASHLRGISYRLWYAYETGKFQYSFNHPGTVDPIEAQLAGFRKMAAVYEQQKRGKLNRMDQLISLDRSGELTDYFSGKKKWKRL